MYKKRALSIFLIIVMLVSFVFNAANADDELEQAKQDKKSIDNQINQIKNEKKNELNEKAQLEQEKKNLINTEKKENEEYQNLLEEISELEKILEEVEKALKEAEENYENQVRLFKAHMSAMYKNSNETILDIILESRNIVDFLERFELISLLSKRDKQIAEQLKVAKEDVEYKRHTFLEQKAELQKAIEEKRNRLESLKASRTSLDSQIQSTKRKLEILEKQEKELLAKSEEIGNLIITLSTRKKYVEGQMVWPTPSCSTITSAFGRRRHPVLRYISNHTGIDIGAKSGANILAANKGTVIVAGWQGAYGNTIIIDHGGGITTLYGHCSKLLVKAGQEVDAGQIIAKVGSTGLSTGPHLHFEVRVNGTPQDPLKYVSYK
ncbi:MAG: peptidoglycan DD-metalloendopeptidase family protein [Clostridiaceae bacterium]|nr:peptidoglycan DD-metalloendopeptidase family protein [Clostridiaceae bacterium]